jgi:hypothetical protein
LQECFQRSAETIQMYVHPIHLFGSNLVLSSSVYSTLACLVGPFYTKHLHLPSNDTPPEIKKEPKFYPYFRNCRGAIDGSHFHAWVLLESMARYVALCVYSQLLGGQCIGLANLQLCMWARFRCSSGYILFC